MIPIAMALAQFAPQIIGLLAGKKAGDVADQVVGIAQTITGTSTPEAAVAAVQADPEKALEFQRAIAEKEIELARIDAEVLKAQFGVTIAQLDADVKTAQTDAADRADARGRDVHLMQAGRRNVRADVMVALDVVGLITCLVILALYRANLPGEAVGIISTVAGIFGACLRDAHQFEFGSSRSSQAKDELLAKR